MAQYQSFPDAAGDSLTLDKLKALSLPDMRGKSFLDVGCNEGFFCGFASFQGASRSVGIDHAAGFIERARKRFPACEFHHGSWDKLPEGGFDVILLASALHYADDQEALLRKLIGALTPDGVLVLELGIVSSSKSEWVQVKRGIDERAFPTMPKLREILEDYAWKWMGPSVSQDGDPVARHVLHISRRRPVAYLLLQPPAYGKTSIASRLFPKAGVQLVSGDHQIGLVARGKLEAPAALKQVIVQDYSPFRLDQMLRDIFDAGLGAELVQLWIDQARGGDLALDVYVPPEQHAAVEHHFRERGYLPIQLRWDRPGPRLLPKDKLDQQAEAFYMSLGRDGAASDGAKPAPARTPMGFVDEVNLEGGRLVVRGWAIEASGDLPSQLSVTMDGGTSIVGQFERQLRPDVQRHLHLDHGLVGYRFTLKVAEGASWERIVKGLKIGAARDGAASGRPYEFAAPIARRLASA